MGGISFSAGFGLITEEKRKQKENEEMDTNTNSMINRFITVCYGDDYDSGNGIYNVMMLIKMQLRYNDLFSNISSL